MPSLRKLIQAVFVALILSTGLPRTWAGGGTLTVVVLGSSTAWGLNATPISQSWVNRYSAYLQSLDPGNHVVNLAVSGFTTYQILPSGTPPHPGRPSVFPGHNITAALSLHPDAIIVNTPSNDTVNGYPVQEQQANYQAIAAAASDVGVPLWVATTQPRNIALPFRQIQMTMRDWINSTYGPKAIDFWTTLADSDGLIERRVDSGDGIHFNNAGHAILFERVVQAGILQALNRPVACPTLGMSDLSPATVAAPYREQITVTGGTGDYSFAGSGLPSWLDLSASGVLTGTPPDSSAAIFQVTATDLATLCSSTRNYTLAVNCAPIDLPPPQLPEAIAGRPYNVALGPPPDPTIGPGHGSRYVFSGTLPAGLVLHPDGTITGTPTSTGADHFTITITDTVTGCEEQSSEAIQIACPDIVLAPSQGATTVMAGATAGQQYSQTVGVLGATDGYTFSVDSGSLPPGLDLGANGGAASIAGIPSVAGTYQFVITATETDSGCTGTQTYSIIVNCPTLALTPSSGASTALPDAGVDQAYSQTISVKGGSGSYGISSSTMPAWLSLTPSSSDPAQAVLAGTPPDAGDIAFTVTATDSMAPGCNQSQMYSLHVAGPLPAIVCPNNLTATAVQGSCGAAVALAVKASGTPIPTVVYRLHNTDSVLTPDYVFPVGVTTVDCTASNGLVPDATCSFDVIVSAAPLPASPSDGFYQGFEVDSAGWTGGPVSRVPSGTHGIASYAGDFHAEAFGPANTQTASGTAVTDFGGARSVFFQGGYTTSIAVYLDVTAIPANDARVAWDSAVNDSSGALRRDFVFNIGGYTDSAQPFFAISAGLSTDRTPTPLTDPANDPLTIGASGWYVLQHRFTAPNGVLQAEMSVLDATGSILHTWTLSDPTDAICGIGGNRTGSFSLQEFPYVDFDDTSLMFNDAAVRAYFRDADGDGFGDSAALIRSTASAPPTGYVTTGTDCNDSDATVQGPKTYYRDADGDGYGDPNDSTVFCSAAATITINGSAYVSNHDDCNDSDASITYPVAYYRDRDGDGYGDPASPLLVCSNQPPAGYVRGNTDCNDRLASIHPGARDVTDGVDNNCNGFSDEGPALTVDFETIPGGQAVADAFAAQSVHFRNAIAVQDSHPFQNYFPPSSGLVNAVNGDSGSPLNADIEVAFDEPEQFVSAFVTAKNTVAMSAYDSAGNVLGVATASGNYQGPPGGTNQPNALLKVASSTSSIVLVVFSDSRDEPSSIAIDDLSFAPTGYPCNLAGVTRALRIASGLDAFSGADAPLRTGAGALEIDLSDAVRLARCAAGLDSGG